MARTLTSPEALRLHLDDPTWIVFDCRFRLDAPEHGHDAFVQATIPGARYADLERDLSGPVVPSRTGRHPLPDPELLTHRLRAWGLRNDHQVVAFDDAGGAFAARLWWLLRWLGHDAVAVLDGGWQAWQRSGGPTAPGQQAKWTPGTFDARIRSALAVDGEALAATLPDWILIDARAPERFSGTHEPIDPIAGHIAGAHNLPYTGNLDEQGRFLPPEVLRERFASVARAPERAVSYCGSGVTACHNILALEHAGIADTRLYPGSWSEWITDPSRPREP